MQIKEQNLHFILDISLWLKSVFAFLEVVGGALFYFTNNSDIVRFISYLTSNELNEDPKDIIANYLLSWSHTIFLSTQHFIAFYLLSHGIIKLAVIIGLLRNKLWAYPSSIAVFSAFIFYQLYRFNFTHSIWLLVLTFFDTIIVWMIAEDYLLIKQGGKKLD